MDEVKMDGKTLDITKMNIEALKELFPDVVEEGKIDFEKLRTILGDEIDSDDERYNFTWHGKNQAIRISQTPSMGTLRPCKEKSVDWDNTNNIYIEGDNLEVLKLLQKSYFGKIKMIYIDPPYNTGDDFIYPDDYKDNIKNYQIMTGQIDSEGRRWSSNTESEGRFHSKWLSMMYPRLRLARNLLSENGVLFISIDDHEIENLLRICREVFYEDLVDVMVWRKSGVGRDGKMKNTSTFRKDHEYIVVCFKSIAMLKKSLEKPEFVNEYSNPDDDPRGPWLSGSLSRSDEASNPNHENYYTVVSPSGVEITRQFEISKEEFDRLNNDGRISWGKNGSSVPRIKVFVNEKREVTTSSYILTPSDIINTFAIDNPESTTTIGSKELEQMLNCPDLGSEMRPKPSFLIKKLVQISTEPDSIVLDFFSGTSTTAQAVLELNREDGGSRRFIMVQIPQDCDEKTAAYKAGYKTICDIAKARIDTVINSMSKVHQKTIDSLTLNSSDLGYRWFSLDSSNIRKWNGAADDIQKTLASFEDNLITENRSDLDVVYELLIKLGLPLNTPVDEMHLNQYRVYSIGYGALMIYLGEVDSTIIAEEMIKLHDEKQPEIWKVVFKDNGFTSDSVKANVRETLKAAGLNEDSFITL